MSQYIIIFTNNDGLKEFYQHIGSKDNNWVDQHQMCFLPGNGEHIKFKTIKELPLTPLSGVYLFYDGNLHNADYNRRDIIAAIKQLKKARSPMYLCYHIRNLEKIVSEIDLLKIKWATEPLMRHHFEPPYDLLAEYFQGSCSLDKLSSVWTEEDGVQLAASRALLESALRDAAKTKSLLKVQSFHNVVRDARLSDEEQALLEEFIRLVAADAPEKEIKAVKDKLVQRLKKL